MNKLEKEFGTWWEREGQEFLFALNTTTDDDIKLVAEVAWKNGAYCAEQAEQEPVAYVSEVYQSRYTLEWNGRSLPEGTPLYAAPVRTKDLTDDDKANLVMEHLGVYALTNGKMSIYDAFLLGIEKGIAADREKNK